MKNIINEEIAVILIATLHPYFSVIIKDRALTPPPIAGPTVSILLALPNTPYL
jgi:hypothetical protein